MAHNARKVKKDDDGIRIDRWLKENAPEIGFGLMQKLLRKGAIRADGKRMKPSDRIAAGQEIRWPLIEAADNSTSEQGGEGVKRKAVFTAREMEENFDSRIIFKNNHVVALNKPYGLPTQGGSGVRKNVDDMAKQSEGFAEAPRIIHRLDKDTSGVLLMALSRKASQLAMESFKEKSFEKTYWALIKGVPSYKEGKIDIPLAAMASSGGEKTVPYEGEEAKRAVTRYEVVETAGQVMSWVAVYPETGRKHQIRAHMAAIGHPIVGDGKYGGAEAFVGGMSERMHLHAARLYHHHFLGSTLDIYAPLPDHMVESWKMVGLTLPTEKFFR